MLLILLEFYEIDIEYVVVFFGTSVGMIEEYMTEISLQYSSDEELEMDSLLFLLEKSRVSVVFFFMFLKL